MTNERNYTLIEPPTPKIHAILKDSNYKLSVFSEQAIIDLENRIFEKNGKSYIRCLSANRDGEYQLKPEEIVRQLYIDKLINEYGYPVKNIQAEVGVEHGNAAKGKAKPKDRIDILVLTDDGADYIVIEVKKPKSKDGSSQLESYIRWKNAPLGVLCNGESIEDFYYNKENKNQKTTKLEKLSNIPHYNQSLKSFLSGSFTLKNLFITDDLQQKNTEKNHFRITANHISQYRHR